MPLQPILCSYIHVLVLLIKLIVQISFYHFTVHLIYISYASSALSYLEMNVLTFDARNTVAYFDLDLHHVAFNIIAGIIIKIEITKVSQIEQ